MRSVMQSNVSVYISENCEGPYVLCGGCQGTQDSEVTLRKTSGDRNS